MFWEISIIINFHFRLLRQTERRLSTDGIKKLFLDFINRRNLGLKIILSLYKRQSKEKPDSAEKVQKLLNFIRALIADAEDTLEEDINTFENEQNEVSKMIFAINSTEPQVIYEIYGELKNVFVDGGSIEEK